MSMRKLDRTEIQLLVDNQHVTVRLSRAGRSSWIPEYEGPATLYVQHHHGVAVVLTTREIEWAEADPRHDVEPDGSIIVEDYQMEVYEPTEVPGDAVQEQSLLQPSRKGDTHKNALDHPHQDQR
jgi:hypothetical protein